MRITRRSFPPGRLPGLLFAAGLGLLLWAGLHSACPAAEPLPVNLPGVRTTEAQAPQALPFGLRAEGIAIDWSHPFLTWKLTAPDSDRARSGLSLDRIMRDHPQSLHIQLIEPRQHGDHWLPALPFHLPDASFASAQAAAAIDFHPLCPWLPAGSQDAGLAPLISPLATGRYRAGVRWLGLPAAVDSLPTHEFDSRCLVSFLDPYAGRTRLFLLLDDAGARHSFTELAPWLTAEAASGEVIAIHSAGPHAWAALDDWRLGAAADPRRAERTGLVLRLSSIQQGDWIDLARLQGARVKASSFETNFAPQWVARGLLWPTPYNPRAWISRLKSPPAPYIEIEFDVPQTVHAVDIAWADAAGWSEDFRPARAQLVYRSNTQRWQSAAEFTEIDQPVSHWRPEAPVQTGRLRLNLPLPSRQLLDPRARVAAFRVWGRWDGVAAPNPTH